MSNETQGTEFDSARDKWRRGAAATLKWLLVGFVIVVGLVLLGIAPGFVLGIYWFSCLAASCLVLLIEMVLDTIEKRRRNGR